MAYTCGIYEREGILDPDHPCDEFATYFFWTESHGPSFACNQHMPMWKHNEWQPMGEWDEQRYQDLRDMHEARMRRIFPEATCE